jgi:hypothetical protein
VTAARPAIWDVLLFNDELSLLEVRLELLAGVVDHVVIVEGTTTFTGHPKKAHYRDSGMDVSAFPGDVRSLVVELDAVGPAPWDRENAQRAAIGTYVREHAAPGDLVLIGDVDEMPKPELLARLAQTLERPARLRMVDALYFANWHQDVAWVRGPIATRIGGLDHPSVGAILGVSIVPGTQFVEEYVPDAGWHLSFLGGAETIRRKLAAYSHQELNTDATRREPYLENCLRYGAHFAGWAPVRKRGRNELDPELSTLASRRPALFDFTPATSRAATLTWCGWAWVRRRLPGRLVAWFDGHPRAVFLLLGPLLLPMQAVRDARRRRTGPVAFPPGKTFAPSDA